MARIRTIKPEFFTSEDIVELSPLTRLFYISLWCEADREGRLAWKPKTLKLRYFPGDDKSSFESSVAELIESDLVKLYEVDGDNYCWIPSFTEHQVINNRETESKIPPFNDQEWSTTQENDASGTRESGVKAEGKGKERKGREGKGTRAKVATTLPDDFSLTDKMREWFGKQSDFFLDIDKTTSMWKDSMLAKGYEYKDWVAAWRTGMNKAHEWHLKSQGSGQVVQMQQRKRVANGFAAGFEK